MRPGDTIADRFVIEANAGHGGMATVYRAFDRLEGRLVALKVMRGEMVREAARFEREASILASLSHPSIVRYVAHGREAEGRPFLVMQWLDGESLSARLSRKPLTVGESLTLTAAIAEALAVAHRAGLVHRDVKPSNIFLPGGAVERPVLIDFGIARGEGVERLTATGVAIGSWAYMAPEQASGLVDVDPRTDVFSLGCVLYLCLTGWRPFGGAEPAVILAKILSEEPKPIRELRATLEPGLEDLVQRMLAKEPDLRPADGRAVAEAIRKLEGVRGEAHDAVPEFAPSLTDTEQRLTWAIFVPSRGDWAPTLGEGELVANTPGEDHLRATLSAHGDAVDFLPDGTAAVILQSHGAPIDTARRAARAALRLLRQLESPALALVGGLSEVSQTGPVMRLVPHGRELLSRTGHGSIAIDELTAGLVRGAFVIAEEDGLLTLSGERSDADAARLLLGRRTSCVGRKRELAILEASLDECVSEPVARAILIASDAGTGKSRLRYEFLRRIRNGEDDVTVLLGRADTLGAGASLAPLAQAIRAALGVDEDADLDAQRERLRGRLHEQGVEAADATAAMFGEILGVPFAETAHASLEAARHTPGVLGDAMRAAFEDWLSALVARGPVLLVLEDLHNADPATVQFVDGALRTLEEAPFMVLALARPAVHERFPHLWEARELQEIRLTSLTKRACAQLVREVLGDAVSAVEVDRIVELSDGNAFFLEELVRAAARGDGGAARPRSVLSMLAARLDDLHPDARRVLRAGSIFGSAFGDGDVAALLGGDFSAEARGHWLHDLADRELLSASPTAEPSRATTYRFRHALVREAVYGTLTERDRVAGHRLAADHIEREGLEEPVVLAEHLTRGQQPERAVGAFLRAAEQGLESNDFGGAIALAERSMECGADAEERGRLRLIEAHAHQWLGDKEAAGTRAVEAIDLLTRGTAPWYQAVGLACATGGRTADIDRLHALADTARAVEPTSDAVPDAVICLCRAAGVLLQAMEYSHVDALLAEAAALASRVASLPPIATTWLESTRGLRSQHAGDTAMQLFHQQLAARAADASGDRRLACIRGLSLGYAHAKLGDYDGAERELAAALVTTQRLGIRTTEAYARENLGMVYAHQGRIEEAYAQEDEVIRLCAGIELPHLEGGARIYRSLTAHRAGDAVRAEREARDALAHLESIPSLRGEALAWLARALLEQDRAAEALEVSSEAVGILEREGGLEDGEAVIRLVHAEALHATGDEATARDALSGARSRLLERTGRISDEALRQSCLEAVPEHARTLALAEAWGLSNDTST